MTKRVFYFDYLRILSCFAVVILHVAAQNWGNVSVDSADWAISNLYDSMVRWCVPIFLMISGALFLEKPQPIAKIWKKNIARIFAAFLIWSAIYAVFRYGVLHETSSVHSFFLALIGGHFHMWFLYTLIGLYAFVPFLQRVAESKKLTVYYLVLVFLFSFLLPQSTNIIEIKYGNIAATSHYVQDNLGLNRMFGYSGYFLGGYFLHHAKIGRKLAAVLYAAGLLGVVITAAATLLLSRKTQAPTELFYGNMTVNVFLTSIAVFVFAKRNWDRSMPTARLSHAFAFLSKSSFGVYLVHILILVGISGLFHFHTLSVPAVFSVPLLSLAVFLISYGISCILNLIPGIKQWMV